MQGRRLALKILFVGEEATGRRALTRLLEHDSEVVAVACAGRGSLGSTAKELAQSKGIPVFDPSFAATPAFADWLRQASVDLLLNVHSLRLLPREVVEAPSIGSFNLHPGPLPRYGGLNAPSWAIYEGATEYAVTLHWMDSGIDSGPLAYVAPVPIEERDTGVTLSVRCARMGLPLLDKLLDAATCDRQTIPRVPQPPGEVRALKAGPPLPGDISWLLDARGIVRLVRASDYRPFESPWGTPTTSLAQLRIGLVDVELTQLRCERQPGTVGTTVGQGVHVATSDAWVLVRKVLVGDTVVAAADVLTPGDRLGGH